MAPAGRPVCPLTPLTPAEVGRFEDAFTASAWRIVCGTVKSGGLNEVLQLADRDLAFTEAVLQDVAADQILQYYLDVGEDVGGLGYPAFLALMALPVHHWLTGCVTGALGVSCDDGGGAQFGDDGRRGDAWWQHGAVPPRGLLTVTRARQLLGAVEFGESDCAQFSDSDIDTCLAIARAKALVHPAPVRWRPPLYGDDGGALPLLLYCTAAGEPGSAAVELPPQATAGDLVARVCPGAAPDGVAVLYHGRILPAAEPLADAGVCAEATVELVGEEAVDWQRWVRMLTQQK